MGVKTGSAAVSKILNQPLLLSQMNQTFSVKEKD